MCGRKWLSVLLVTGLVVLWAPRAEASCARHNQTPLTRAFVLDYALRVSEVVEKGHNVSVHPTHAALFERIFNQIYRCNPQLLKPDYRTLAYQLHEGISRLVNAFDQEACYGTLPRAVAEVMVRIMRREHACFPEK